MGGVGKTAICRELAHRCSLSKELNDVIWLNAHLGLESELKNILAPEYQIDIKNSDWLSKLINKLNQSPSPSIIFIDNLELTEKSTVLVRQLKRLNWHLFATSRYSLEQFDTKKMIDVLSSEQCMQLFIKNFNKPVSSDEKDILSKLITLAGRHTLTVELLAKTAESNGFSVSEIYEQVKKTGFDLSQLTNTPVEGNHRETELQDNRQYQLHEHLSKLFQLSHISNEEKNLLRTLAILPYQQYHGKNELAIWFGFKNQKSFISLAKKGWLQHLKESFSIHPVVGYVVKQEIKLQPKYLNAFIKEFNLTIKPRETEHIIEKSLWIPHLLVIIEVQHEDTLITATSLKNLAMLYQSTGAYDQALPLHQRSLDIMEKKLDPDHIDLAYSLDGLAGLHQSMGAYDQALPMYLRALNIVEKKRGSDHNDVAISLNNLAWLYQSMGAYDQALPLHMRALNIQEKNLGSEDLTVAGSLNNLAGLYESKGSYYKALPLNVRALNRWEKVLDPDHPEVASSLTNLAGVYESMGTYDKALPLYLRAINAFEKKLGPEHPNVAISLTNLAVLYEAMEAYDQALPLYQRALDIFEKVYHPDHSYVARTLTNLAELYKSMRAYDQALPLSLRELDLQERILGFDHPDVASSLNKLAELCK